MPRYEYRCPKCGHEQEAILPWTQAMLEQTCAQCDTITERLISRPMPAQTKETGRDHVLKTLNREGGRGLPASPRDMPRMEAAYAKGLDQTRPVIGIGI